MSLITRTELNGHCRMTAAPLMLDSTDPLSSPTQLLVWTATPQSQGLFITRGQSSAATDCPPAEFRGDLIGHRVYSSKSLAVGLIEQVLLALSRAVQLINSEPQQANWQMTRWQAVS